MLSSIFPNRWMITSSGSLVQQKIAQEVKSSREKAKLLKKAKEFLEKAKKEVEELIEKK
jgi:hypothetical protein